MTINAAIIEAGRIANVIVLDAWDDYPGAISIPEGYWIGDLYDAGTGQFSHPEPDLMDLKRAKLAQIVKDRDAQRYAPVTAHGRTWQADQTSQDLLNGAINLAGHGVPLPAVWRDADNSDMLISNLTDLLVIAGVMAAQTQQAYSTSWQRKKAVEIATTVEEVETV